MAARIRRSSSFDGKSIAVIFCVFMLALLTPMNRAMATPFAAVVMDARSGVILHAINHDTRLHPASLTKMMTLYVTFEAIQNGEVSLDTRVRISRRAATEVPSRLGLREGQTIALRYLIRAAALRSGNDAATAIAEAIGGSVEGFAARMNRTAAAIGMTSTRFHNAHGLTASGHLSTARDMTILGRQLYFDYPQYYNIFSRRSEDAGIAQVRNTNSRFLDAYPGADGIKTGFTNAAGYNLTAMAERNGVRIIVTVFGGRSVMHRHEQVVQLMNRGFREAPARVALRRPSRPNYSAVPLVASAGASTSAIAIASASASGQNRAAGRVIRLQTAPERSVFPARRPLRPEELPSEELLAALQSDINTVLAEVANPAPDAPAPSLVEEAIALAAAPARSPLPAPRPGEQVGESRALSENQDSDIDDLLVARATGVTTIDPQEYLDLATSGPEGFEGDDAITITLLGDGRSAAAPAPAPGGPDEPTLTAALAVQDVTETPAGNTPDAETPIATAITEDSHSVSPLIVLPPTEELLASVTVANGLVVVPGLPPIAFASAPEPDVATQVDQGEILRVDDDDGSVASVDGADAPILDERIILTSSDVVEPLQASAVAVAPMPEIVTRVSTSGGRVWGVDLGLYPSRFDAERTLLRIALSENGTLGNGVRRVGQRSGRFVAGIHSLTQEQAELACLRLSVRAQTCDVVHP